MNVVVRASFITCAVMAIAYAQTPTAQRNIPTQTAAQAPPNVGPLQTNTELDTSDSWYHFPVGTELGVPLAVASDGKGQILFYGIMSIRRLPDDARPTVSHR